MDRDLTDLRDRIEEVVILFNDGFAKLVADNAETLRHIVRRFEDIGGRFEGIDKRFDAMAKRFDDADERHDVLRKEMDAGFNSVLQAIAGLQG